ncbi:hypothetical protein [Streptomyces sp. NPDC005017]|uniref:hypothetical protein n=1 Tax=Streptomyces sp. NPDC005017 TaxID=3364706 RepID=UPI0036D10CBC
MGIGTRHVSTSAATALLLLFPTLGTAAIAAEAPVEDPAAPESQTAELNDLDWEDGIEYPVDDREVRRCDGPSTWIKITSKKSYHVPSWWNGTKYKDGPGGTMTVEVTKSGTISGEITLGAEAEFKAVVAKAKVSVSGKIAASVGVTVGHRYTHDVHRNKYGHLQYGAWGYKVAWEKYRSSGNGCDDVKIGSGKATLPTTETGWRFWETSS